MLIVRGAAKGLADERRIEAPATWLNGLLRTVEAGRGLILPPGIWILVLLALLVAGTLRYTVFGRTCSRSARTSARPACAACAWRRSR